jgi:hypothetical protein
VVDRGTGIIISVADYRNPYSFPLRSASRRWYSVAGRVVRDTFVSGRALFEDVKVFILKQPPLEERTTLEDMQIA